MWLNGPTQWEDHKIGKKHKKKVKKGGVQPKAKSKAQTKAPQLAGDTLPDEADSVRGEPSMMDDDGVNSIPYPFPYVQAPPWGPYPPPYTFPPSPPNGYYPPPIAPGWEGYYPPIAPGWYGYGW